MYAHLDELVSYVQHIYPENHRLKRIVRKISVKLIYFANLSTRSTWYMLVQIPDCYLVITRFTPVTLPHVSMQAGPASHSLAAMRTELDCSWSNARVYEPVSCRGSRCNIKLAGFSCCVR